MRFSTKCTSTSRIARHSNAHVFVAVDVLVTVLRGQRSDSTYERSQAPKPDLRCTLRRTDGTCACGTD